MKRISVIIPFYNEIGTLQLCLQCLYQQTYPQDALEILAVNNSAILVPPDVVSANPRVRWLNEPKPGSYSARNCGLRHAAGDVIAFTDADCQPSPTWLEEGIRKLKSGDATIIGGSIELINPTGRALNIYEVFETQRFAMGNTRRMIEVKGFAATANLITYRSVFDRVGPFDSDLRSSGDREWTLRATTKGEKIQYARKAVVYHPRRGTFDKIYRKSKRLVGGKIMLLRKDKASVRRYVREFYCQSVFRPVVHFYAISAPGITGIIPRLKFFFLVEVLSILVTIEKFRVLLGGEAHRG